MDRLRRLLQRQGYGFAGEHTAVKLCTWLKKSLHDLDYCYKQQFYGIKSHLCCQMSPAVGFCQNSCVYCWREMELTRGTKMEQADEPTALIDSCIEQQRKLMSGFGGDAQVNKKKLAEAQEPMHFAISLTGEPTLYPHLSQLIKELHSRGKTSYLVTNGLLPGVLQEIEVPTQLYLSVEAPNRRIYGKLVKSSYRDAWERQQKSLDVLKRLKGKTKTVLRITAIKGMNMVEPEGYAEMIRKAEPDFVEVKAYMFVGSSRQRLSLDNMPLHSDVRDFAMSVVDASGYSVKDEKKESRVVLLCK
jgi:tRNA wybutosine-synthesizing protein 1